MKIAVLNISIGRYTAFWPALYNSCEQYFFPDAEKHYFVFTDKPEIFNNFSNIHLCFQEDLGWPDNTLKRFHMFSLIQDELTEYDYIFFFNANCLFMSHIGSEILPVDERELIVVQHPGFYNKPSAEFTYDRNPDSNACIEDGDGVHYVCGGINGGAAETYLKFIRSIRAAVDEDDSRGVTALWHDESHLNRYLLTNPYKLLDPGFCYPEWECLPYALKILIRDKAELGGHEYFRGKSLLPKLRKRKVVVGGIYAGLGNQMFQFAAARSLSWRHRQGLVLDNSYFVVNEDQGRDYLLPVFPNIAENYSPESEKKSASRLGCKLRNVLIIKIARLKRRKAKNRLLRKVIRYVEEPHFHYWDELHSLKGRVYLHGYWQSDKYFKDIASILRHDFQFPQLSTEEACEIKHRIEKSQNSVALHFRRGDYLGLPLHHVDLSDYYRRALAYLSDILGQLSLFVFSDDPEWVKDHFKSSGHAVNLVDIREHRDAPWHDMHLISLCEHQIIANSTFSWWGAWLNDNDEKVVIAPGRWFNDDSMNTEDLYPADWKVM